jgi:hypothetical protein
MYIRWKKKASRGNCQKWRDWKQMEDTVRSAYVVENARIEGKPRQKIIACLGSFHEYDLDRLDTMMGSETTRQRFARVALRKIRALKLSDEQEAGLCSALNRQLTAL